MRFPVAVDGIPFVLGLLLVSALLVFLQCYIVAAIAFAICLFLGCFFRDPKRSVSADAGVLLSPADGKVINVSEVKPSDDHRQPETRVSVFMSVLNCHVNRSPVTGSVASVQHINGRFLAAFRQQASEVNERAAITLVDDSGENILCTQIAGLIARRIVCRLKSGDSVTTGQRIGLIKFGSRVDVVMPPTYSVLVKAGEKVKAGLDVIGRRRTRNQSTTHIPGKQNLTR